MRSPSVVILIPTYARVAWLQEAVYSALQQTHPGAVLVYVLNDCPRQRLHSVDPRVIIHNAREEFPTLGAKRNYMMDVGRSFGEWIAFVDDDDILLPWHLAAYFQSPVTDLAVIGTHSVYLDKDTPSLCPGGPVVRMAVIAHHEARFGADLDSGEDQVFYRQVAAHSMTVVNTIAAPSYIYCWNNGVHHTSGSGQPRVAIPLRAEANARMDSGSEPTGDITLSPAWRRDYVLLTSSLRR